MQRFALALFAIVFGGAVVVSLILNAVRKARADRVQGAFLALTQELRLQPDFSALWGSRPLPTAIGQVDGVTVRVESKLYRARRPWFVRTHIEATRRDRQGPVGLVGNPPRVAAPAGAEELVRTAPSGQQVVFRVTQPDVLNSVLTDELVGELASFLTRDTGVVLHPDRVEFVTTPVDGPADKDRVVRAARIVAAVARKLSPR